MLVKLGFVGKHTLSSVGKKTNLPNTRPDLAWVLCHLARKESNYYVYEHAVHQSVACTLLLLNPLFSQARIGLSYECSTCMHMFPLTPPMLKRECSEIYS